MARKSRKNLMPQAAVQEAVQQNEKELLRTAAYARLSVENGGHETEDSLHTQILQIHNYIRENPELTLTDTYADNGFTGTRFDRPEFERMMRGFLNQSEFDEELVHELIKRIYVGMDNSVEVEFKCSDPYQEVLAIMSEVQNE